MSKRDDLVSFRWEFRGGGRRRRMESLDIVRRRYRRVSINFELIFGNWQDFLCLREGVQRDLHGGKRINFFFFFLDKGKGGMETGCYSIQCCYCFRCVFVPFAKGEKERHFSSRFGKKYDPPEASIGKVLKRLNRNSFYTSSFPREKIVFEIILQCQFFFFSRNESCWKRKKVVYKFVIFLLSFLPLRRYKIQYLNSFPSLPISYYTVRKKYRTENKR